MRDDLRERYLNVLWHYIIPALDIGDCFGHCGQRKRCTGASAAQNHRVIPRSVNQRYDIVNQFCLDVNSSRLVLHGDQFLSRKDLPDRLQRIDTLPGKNHIAFIFRRRISDRQPDGEPVHLRIRQQLRTGGSGRVLRGKDDEWLWNRVADTIDCDLPLLHCFQQCGLRA